MPTNDILPFATGVDANVLSQSAYAALAALSTGWASGRANSAEVNKAIRQASIMVAALASFIVDNAVANVVDDGTTATIKANIKLAVQNIILAYGYAPLASPSLTGSPKSITPAGASNDTSIATSAFVKTALSPYAPLASPAFSGVPSCSTFARGTNSGALASTAYVIDALTQYYTASQISSILSAYYTAAQVNSILTSYYTAAQVNASFATLSYLNGTFWPASYIGANFPSNSTMNSAFVSSNAQSGYTRLWNGLIIQWGLTAIAGATFVTLPTTWPTGMFTGVASDAGDGHNNSTCYACTVSAVDNSSIELFSRTIDGTQTYIGSNVSWFAIGH